MIFSKSVHLPIKIWSIEEDGFHLSINAKINNKKALMLIDTGASKTVFDFKKIRRLVGSQLFEKNEKLSTGLGTNSMETHTTVLNKFRLGNLTLPGFQTVLLDLSHVNDSYKKLGLPAIDGVLGSDVLVLCKAVINYRKKELVLTRP